MKRDQLRDEIRTLAEIGGDNTFDFLINDLIDKELKKYTSLRKYPQAFLTGVVLSWEDNALSTLFYPFAKLPTDLQHIDVNSIFYNNEQWNTNLSKWSRIYANTTQGRPTQFRRCTYLSAHTASYDQVLEITPASSINFATDTIRIDYWRFFSWDDIADFPISELEMVVMNNVVSRIANLQNTGLAKKADIAAEAAYIASRGVNTGDKF